jgi:hypothetical protein
MSEGISEISTNLQARIAGSLYIIIIVGAVFAPFPVVPSGLMRGDAAVTATKMMASKSLYSLGGAAELVVYACDLGVALIFYELLKPVSRPLALLAAFFRLAYVGIAGANVLNHFAPLLFMSGGEYLTPFQPDQLRAVAITFIRLHTIGLDIALVFFGFHCIVAGYLFFRSIFFPRILGMLLALGGVGYVVNISANLVPPGIGAYLFPYILAPGGIAEISLALWLLLMGVNVQRWKEQAAAALRESL